MIPVRLSASAERDIVSIQTWLTQPGAGPAASEQLERLFRAIGNLAEEWAMWPPIDTPRIPKSRGLRKRISGEYLVSYVVDGAGDGRRVLIVRVFGPGQYRD